MLKIIRNIIQGILDDIDSGNSNLTTEEAVELIENLKRFTNKDKRLSKYGSYTYLNVSRATFDNYVKEGKIPKGKHEAGFKELSWRKIDLDAFIAQNKKDNE